MTVPWLWVEEVLYRVRGSNQTHVCDDLLKMVDARTTEIALTNELKELMVN